MKNDFILCLGVAALLTLAACDHQESSPSESQTPAESASAASGSEDLKSQAQHFASEVKETAQQTAAEVKTAAKKTAIEVKQTTKNLTADASASLEKLRAEAQSLIDKAQTLAQDKRFNDAMAILQRLSSLSLNPEQQKAVDDLKSQIKALASNQAVTNAAAALNQFLKQ